MPKNETIVHSVDYILSWNKSSFINISFLHLSFRKIFTSKVKRNTKLSKWEITHPFAQSFGDLGQEKLRKRNLAIFKGARDFC
jgi:hypothetical protein